MPDKKHLLVTLFFLALASTVFAQESQQAPGAAGTGTATPTSANPQWSNRDMTYRGKNYDVLDSAYYPKFRRKQFKKYISDIKQLKHKSI